MGNGNARPTRRHNTGRASGSNVAHLALPVNRADHLAFAALTMIGADGRCGRGPHPVADALGTSVDACDLFIAAHEFGLASPASNAFAGYDALREPTSPFRLYDDVATTSFLNQRRAWTAIGEAFGRADIPCLVFKGLQVQSDGFRGVPRLLSDIDLLVHEADGARAIDTLHTLGYGSPVEAADTWVPGHYEAPVMQSGFTAPRLESHSAFIELIGAERFFARATDGTFIQVVAVDLHHNVLLPKIPEEELWEQPYEFTIDGVPTRAPAIALTAWLLAVRLYDEVTRGDRRAARMLADLVVLARRHGVPEDELFARAVRNDNTPAVFYVYSFLQRFCGIPVDDGLLDELRRFGMSSRHSKRDKTRAADRGDFVPYLFGRRPSRAPDMWFLYDMIPDDSMPLSSADAGASAAPIAQS